MVELPPGPVPLSYNHICTKLSTLPIIRAGKPNLIDSGHYGLQSESHLLVPVSLRSLCILTGIFVLQNPSQINSESGRTSYGGVAEWLWRVRTPLLQ